MTPTQARDVVEEQFRAYKATLATTAGSCWTGSRSSTWPARWSASAASAPERSWCCCKAATAATRCSCRSRRRPRSVLEDHLPKSRYNTPGQRVVEGQRLMQAASDIFLGWTKGVQADRYYYWRQLRDMKASALVEAMSPFAMTFYARICGWTLARAHARSGDPVAIAEYLGTDDAFDSAITDFSARYADQNQRDYDSLRQSHSRRPNPSRHRDLSRLDSTTTVQCPHQRCHG